MREQQLVSMCNTLGITSSPSYGKVKQMIDKRVMNGLHTNGGIKVDTPGNKHSSCTLMSLNMRSIRNKLTSIEGIDLWTYCRDMNVQGFCIQDHKLHETQAPLIQAAARAVMPSMYNSCISMQEGHPCARGKAKVGGTSFLCGGKLSKYRSKEIKDRRGWGRYTGRVIRGTKHATPMSGQRHHPADAKHDKKTNVAIICVYAAVESDKYGSMWQTQIRNINKLPHNQRQSRLTLAGDLFGQRADPHKQLRCDLALEMRELEREHNCNFIIMGDFNINLNKDTAEVRKMMVWGRDNDLSNLYLNQWGGTDRDKLRAIKDPANKSRLVNTWIKTEKEPR